MLTIAAGEIHVWIARDEEIADPALLQRYLELLDPRERAQQQRFYFPRHRHQYLITRALLRSVLSLYEHTVPPAQWQFASNDYGKPAIAAPRPQCLAFNLSHTEQRVVLAVAAAGSVGIDVEWVPRRGASLDIAEYYFSPAELAQLRSLPETAQRDRFFDLWTLKEAYIKACGMGLSIPLDHFSYLFAEDGRVDLAFAPQRNDDPARWRFWQVDQGPHKIALAAPLPIDTLVVRECVPLSHFNTVQPVVRWHGRRA